MSAHAESHQVRLLPEELENHASGDPGVFLIDQAFGHGILHPSHAVLNALDAEVQLTKPRSASHLLAIRRHVEGVVDRVHGKVRFRVSRQVLPIESMLTRRSCKALVEAIDRGVVRVPKPSNRNSHTLCPKGSANAPSDRSVGDQFRDLLGLELHVELGLEGEYQI
ncbi:MAG: hypothetical protein AB7N70_09080 [Dehalococcoidia bacterium]